PLIPFHIVEEERIRREHADYINQMEMLFTINPHPHPLTYANTNVESFSSFPIPIQDSDPHQEEIDVVTQIDDVLPPSIENNDSNEEEVDVVDDLRVDNSIQNSEHEYFERIESNLRIGYQKPENASWEFNPCLFLFSFYFLFTLTEKACSLLFPILIQDSDPHQEEIDVVTQIDDVLPPSIENNDSDEEEVDAVDDLCVDNSIQNSEHEYFESENSDFDNPSVPLPPPKPPDEEFDFDIDFENEISVVRNTIVKFECRVKFDVFNNKNDDLSYFMFVIFDKMFSLLSAKSEDMIFDPGISD
nr:hypothetical protein [Tanacetum cinerariifolium]